MQRYIAFLRAINVGGHTVKMDRLRELFEALGFANVATFIASGNVIFEARPGNARALEQRIEDHLRPSLGYEVATFIRTASELSAIAGYRPFPAAELDANESLLSIMFLPAPLGREAQHRLKTFRTPDDDFHAHGREIYWLRRKKFSESVVNVPQLNKAIGMPSTMRNATTVRKIAAKYGAAPR